MSASILAGVGNITLRNQTTGDVILTSKTLTDSGITIGVTAEEVRGGESAGLIGQYFHSSEMGLNLVDSLFDLNYIALNVGGAISVGGEAISSETITTTTENQITVTGTPIAWNNMSTIVGWYTLAGKNDWKTITFNGKVATVSNLASGTKICVKYNSDYTNMSQFTVPSAIIPTECYAELTASLFSAGAGGSISTSSKIGELVVEIPRFQLTGAQDFSMTMTGTSTSNLVGKALVVQDSDSCETGGIYGRIKEIRLTGSVYDSLEFMAVSDDVFAMGTGDTKTLKVIGVYSGNQIGTIPNSDLTFTSGTTSVATVTDAGVVSAVASGDSTITVTLTSNTSFDTVAKVTVS